MPIRKIGVQIERPASDSTICSLCIWKRDANSYGRATRMLPWNYFVRFCRLVRFGQLCCWHYCRHLQ